MFPYFSSDSVPVDCEEGNNQTSIRDTTFYCLKESKEKNSLILLKNIKLLRIGTLIKNFIKRVQIHRPNIKIFHKKKNKLSSKILASTQTQSQGIIEKFMRIRNIKKLGKKCKKLPTSMNV